MEKDAFRKYGHKFVDWIADYLWDIEKYNVCSQVRPGEIKNQIPKIAPQEPEHLEKIFGDFKNIILPGITHWQHPSWFAYFPATNSPPSILAELLTAGIGAQCMVWKTSPSATELEEVVLEWLRKMLGLPEGMSGVIQDTASTASLVALLTARERETALESNWKGMIQGLTVYASEESHSSIEKGAKIAGYGKDKLRFIPTDDSYVMIPSVLEETIIQDQKQKLRPSCVVATIGTTSSAAIDPLVEIGHICRRYHVWLHVDAAYAGTAAILPEKKWILEGMEFADSFVFNPHKWMLTNFDCSVYFVKDPSALIRTFEIHPEYLKTREDTQVRNFRDWGVQLGRRFRALKLWFVLRFYGIEGLQKIIRQHIHFAEMFKNWIDEHPAFELMAPVHLSLVCFRLNDGRPEKDLDELNQVFLNKLNQTGRIFLTHTTLKGKFVLRMAIGSRTTEEKHIRKAWSLMKALAKELLD